jgi:hypothetical protein
MVVQNMLDSMGQTMTTYHRRKAAGNCTRCGMPAWEGLLCETHIQMNRQFAKRKKPDDSPDALPYQSEPKRAPYRSDKQPVWPPIPKCCPRCQGFVLTQHEESRCLNCSWYLQPIPCDPIDTTKSGAVLPRVTG